MPSCGGWTRRGESRDLKGIHQGAPQGVPKAGGQEQGGEGLESRVRLCGRLRARGAGHEAREKGLGPARGGGGDVGFEEGVPDKGGE